MTAAMTAREIIIQELDKIAATDTKKRPLTAAERQDIENTFNLWQFGKAGLLADSSAQHIRRQLQYEPRIKESPTFWQSIIPMSEDDYYLLDWFITKNTSSVERKVLKSKYVYHASEESGCRILSMTTHSYRVALDSALRSLRDAVQKG